MAWIRDLLAEELIKGEGKNFELDGYKFIHDNTDGWHVASPKNDNHYALCELVSYEGKSTTDAVAVMVYTPDASFTDIIGWWQGATFGLEPEDKHGLAASLVKLIKDFEGE